MAWAWPQRLWPHCCCHAPPLCVFLPSNLSPFLPSPVPNPPTKAFPLHPPRPLTRPVVFSLKDINTSLERKEDLFRDQAESLLLSHFLTSIPSHPILGLLRQHAASCSAEPKFETITAYHHRPPPIESKFSSPDRPFDLTLLVIKLCWASSSCIVSSFQLILTLVYALHNTASSPPAVGAVSCFGPGSTPHRTRALPCLGRIRSMTSSVIYVPSFLHLSRQRRSVHGSMHCPRPLSSLEHC